MQDFALYWIIPTYSTEVKDQRTSSTATRSGVEVLSSIKWSQMTYKCLIFVKY